MPPRNYVDFTSLFWNFSPWNLIEMRYDERSEKHVGRTWEECKQAYCEANWRQRGPFEEFLFWLLAARAKNGWWLCLRVIKAGEWKQRRCFIDGFGQTSGHRRGTGTSIKDIWRWVKKNCICFIVLEFMISRCRIKSQEGFSFEVIW